MLFLILLQLVDLLCEQLILTRILLSLSSQPLHQLEVPLSPSQLLETINWLVLKLMANLVVGII